MTHVLDYEPRKKPREKTKVIGGKFVVVPSTTQAVLKTHGHTLKSARTLKARLDSKLQFAHAGGK